MSDKEIFLEYEVHSMNETYKYDIARCFVTIYSDGTCIIKVNLATDNLPPRIVKIMEDNETIFQIPCEDMKKLKKSIFLYNFFLIPSDINGSGYDGYESYITVYKKGKPHKCGGYLPSNKNYKLLEEIIYNIIKTELTCLKYNLKLEILNDGFIITTSKI